MKLSTSLLWIFAVWNVAFAVIESSQNPGLQARITQKGFDYAAQAAIDSLSGMIRGLNIPDQSGNENHLEYSLTQIRITSFTKPQSNVLPQAGTGLTWQATGLGLSLNTHFKYKYKKVITIRGSGNVDVSISGTTFSLSMVFGKDSDGRPSIMASGCNCNIGHFSLKFHGGASWLYNLLKGLFIKSLKKQVQKMICSSATSAVNKNAEESLSKLPVTVNIAHKFLLDYRLLSSPSFTSTHMDTFHKGEMFWSAQRSEAPIPPPVVPALTSNTKMLYFIISDYVLNTFGYVAHGHGVLKKNVTGKDLPPSKRSFLNTTCQGSIIDICLGTLIPQTGTKYPNSTAELIMSSIQSPKLTISPALISLNFMGNIVFNARVPNGSVHFMFSVKVGLNTTLKASVKGERVYGEIDKMSIGLNLTKSEIGTLNEQNLQTVMNSAIMLYVKPELNKLCAEGFPLPVTGRVTFANTELTLAKDALILGTDVTYSPKQSKAMRYFNVISGYKSHNHNFKKM